MVVNTILVIGVFILIYSILIAVIFFSEISIYIPVILKLFIIIIFAIPIIFYKRDILHTVKILDYSINRKKIMEFGKIENGIIQEIKPYSLGGRGSDGYYMIVDFNSEKIRSIPFDNNFSYKVGDEIEIIMYKNNKYVKVI